MTGVDKISRLIPLSSTLSLPLKKGNKNAKGKRIRTVPYNSSLSNLVLVRILHNITKWVFVPDASGGGASFWAQEYQFFEELSGIGLAHILRSTTIYRGIS